MEDTRTAHALTTSAATAAGPPRVCNRSPWVICSPQSATSFGRPIGLRRRILRGEGAQPRYCIEVSECPPVPTSALPNLSGRSPHLRQTSPPLPPARPHFERAFGEPTFTLPPLQRPSAAVPSSPSPVGRTLDKSGYALVRAPRHPHCNSGGYIREHRLVMEQVIGRLLATR